VAKTLYVIECGGLFVGMAATPISAEWAPCQNLLATPRFGGATGQ